MTKYDLFKNAEFENLKNILVRTFQSCNLNILLGAGASLPAINTLGNIENDIDQLLKDNKEKEAIKKSYNFLKNIYEQNTIFNTDDENIIITTKNYYNFVNLLYRILKNRKNYKTEPHVNIYTTNYDLFLEYTLETSNYLINYNDGFVNKNNLFRAPNINIVDFNKKVSYKTELYDYISYIPNFNIIKLHGGLNWRVRKNSEIIFENPLKILDDLKNVENLPVKKIKNVLDNIGIVLPNYNKFEKTVLTEIYFNFLRYFSTNLLITNSILFTFGFSFNDNHIKNLVKTALISNPTLHLIISIYNSEELNNFEREFEPYPNVSFIFDSSNNLDLARLNEYLSKIFKGLENDK